MALIGTGCGDDGDDAAPTTTRGSTTTEASTTSSTSTTEATTTSTTEPPTTSTSTTDVAPTTAPPPPTAPGEEAVCPSAVVATALVQAGSALTGASVTAVTCDGAWAVAELDVAGPDPGVAHLRHAAGGWSVGYAGTSIADGCDYAHAQGAPSSVLAGCP